MKKLSAVLVMILSAAVALSSAETRTVESSLADLDPAKDEKVIVDAANWLGEKEEKKAVDKLNALLKDSRKAVRLNCVTALGYIGDDEKLDALHDALLNDSSADVRYAALMSSVRIGSKKSIDVWQKSKEKETDPFMKDFLERMAVKASGK